MYDELVKRIRQVAEEVCEDYDVDPYNAEQRCLAILQAADAIEELSRDLDSMNEANIALYGALPKWIPVTERLPSNSTKVLVFEFGRVEQAYTTTYTADGSLCWVVINGGSYHRISDADCPIKLWMPLPEPPKEG